MKVYKLTGDNEAEEMAEFDEDAGEFVHGGEEVLGMLGVEEVTGDDLWESFDGPFVFCGESDPREDEKAGSSVVEALLSVFGR